MNRRNFIKAMIAAASAASIPIAVSKAAELVQAPAQPPIEKKWRHVMASWGEGKTDVYVDSVLQSRDTSDFKLDVSGDMAEFYLSDESVDLRISTNREKFISNGMPVDLNEKGDNPTIKHPAIFMQHSTFEYDGESHYLEQKKLPGINNKGTFSVWVKS